MRQPEKQDLENRVELLKARRFDALNNAFRDVFVGCSLGASSSFLIYAGIAAPDLPGYARAIFMAGGGGIGISSLIFGMMSVLDYHRMNSFDDQIAEIENSPGYKAGHPK